MRIQKISGEFSVCKVGDFSGVDLTGDFLFLGKTDEEFSLVCRPEAVPGNVTVRDDGWRAFRVEGTLEFSLVGILAGISEVLATAEVGIFAVSTFNTDYILTKRKQFERALEALSAAGYEVV